MPVELIRVGQVAISVAIVMAEPGRREGQAILIAAFENKVEIVVRVDNVFSTASLGRIRVSDSARLIPIEDADSGCLRTGDSTKSKLYSILPLASSSFVKEVRSS